MAIANSLANYKIEDLEVWEKLAIDSAYKKITKSLELPEEFKGAVYDPNKFV